MSRAERCEVGVVVEWQAVDSPWVEHRWRVTGILPGSAATEPWTVLHEAPGLRRYFAGNADLVLFPLETDTLKANIEGPEPSLYVFLRQTRAAPGVALLGATACVGEAGAHADTGSDLVEAVPMPPSVVVWIAGFVSRHHIHRTTFKRRRERWGETEPAEREAASE